MFLYILGKSVLLPLLFILFCRCRGFIFFYKVSLNLNRLAYIQRCKRRLIVANAPPYYTQSTFK